MVIDKTLDELKEAYHNYKKGKYIFGKYGSANQIKDAFQKGKIFVLTSSNKGFLVLIMIFLFPLVYFMLGTMGDDKDSFLFMLLIWGIFTSIVGIAALFTIIFTKRYFVVIGSLGIYYRKIIATNCFQWSEITLAKRGLQPIKYGFRTVNVVGLVNVILPDGKQIKFNSARYKSKELVKTVKREMFINLFQIYSELSDIEHIERSRTNKNIKDS